MSTTTQSPQFSLSEVYRQTLKPKDIFFNVYVCRPLAAVFVRVLLPTRVTPNQVTLFSLSLGLGACSWLVLAAWPGGLWGGIALFEVSYIFDKVDGMLARARGQTSKTGQLLDFLMDEIKALALLGAVGWGVYRHTLQVEYLLAAMAGIVALGAGLSITTFQRRPEIAIQEFSGCGEARTVQTPGLLRKCVAVVEQGGRWVIHYPSYLWLAAVLGDARIFLVPYVVANFAYFARSLVGLAWRYGRFEPRSQALTLRRGIDIPGDTGNSSEKGAG